MLPRFLAADLDPAARVATLDADEAHHLTHVLRLARGDEVAVFDGRGREYRARIDEASRGGARLALLDPIEPAPEVRVHITLAQALLKGEKMDDVVRDATMMGVAAIEPVLTDRALIRLGGDRQTRARVRWQRIAVASAKQSRRAVVPVVVDTAPLQDVFERHSRATRLMLVEPAAAEGRSPADAAGPAPRSAVVLVGPEGGWSAPEVDRARAAGWTLVSLGRRTLRADAVPVIALGVLLSMWGDL